MSKQSDPVYLKCPFCKNEGNDMFVRREISTIHMIDDGETITDVDVDPREHGHLSIDINSHIFEYFCSKCHRDVTEAELAR